MSDEISAGVKILLERAKTNPQEIIEEYGRWGQLRDAVFNYKERNERSAWLRGLTEQEIDLLHETFNGLYREVFDTWVMKSVLGTDEEGYQNVGTQAYQLSRGKRAGQGWTDPRGVFNPYQNSVIASGSGGGGFSSTEQRAEQLGLGHLLKNTLNKIKL